MLFSLIRLWNHLFAGSIGGICFHAHIRIEILIIYMYIYIYICVCLWVHVCMYLCLHVYDSSLIKLSSVCNYKWSWKISLKWTHLWLLAAPNVKVSLLNLLDTHTHQSVIFLRPWLINSTRECDYCETPICLRLL